MEATMVHLAVNLLMRNVGRKRDENTSAAYVAASEVGPSS